MRVGRGLSGFLAFAVLLAVVVATAWQGQPHGYLGESAAPEVFSAGRALRTVEEIARAPHPVGTAEHDRVRDHLAGELRKLGLETEIREGVGRWPGDFKPDSAGLGRVANIVGTLKGTNPTGTVYLVAHYDSVPSGPGANDDGVAVAAILEAVRALRDSENGLRNNVVALFTDGEEPGLLGAESFVAAGDYDRNAVVINHDARGAGGPALLWRITRPDGGLIGVAKDAPHPDTDSTTTALAGAGVSSTTDFVAFDKAGLPVLDWAYAGRSAYYHNPKDEPGQVDLATVQQLGENTLALARDFGERDLADTSNRSNPAYFALPFGVLVVVPAWVIIALAVLSLLIVGWVIRQVRRNGETTVKGVIGSTAVILAGALVAVGATYGWWWLVQRIRPEYRAWPVDPYRPEFFQTAVLVLTVCVLTAGYALARRLFGPTGAAIGLVTGVSVAGAGVTAYSPAAAQILVIPATAAAIGVASTFLVPDRWRLVTLTVFLLPAALLLGGSTWPGLQAGLMTAPFTAVPLVALLGGLLLLTLLRSWPQRRGWTIPALALVLTLVLTAVGLAVDRFDVEHPRVTQVAYALDADHHAAQWLSVLPPDDWTRTFLSGNAPGAPYSALFPSSVSSGRAEVENLSAPIAEILSDTTASGQRTIRLRLRSTRAATRIDLNWQQAPNALRVAGREVTRPPHKNFHFAAPPAEGIEVELVAPAGPLELYLVDYTWLPDSKLSQGPAHPDDTYFRQDSAAAVFTKIPGL
ncbi:M20/M25/M40 family metallo-hydrolase [Nocardia sp. SYP-A9097]|uniref:M20/M25/M40 family metallo-hydrolase n=1 Tax=Nocardia sp. SYP-A9097 TaxID=2663237 RepID=UPI001891BF8C|nr:M20/M25/M40 family metallo-hydrolase [Nocardia sp. SYP-A9097]